MFCSNCGTKLADSARFCSNCGTPVGNAPTSAVSSDSVTEIPEVMKEFLGKVAEVERLQEIARTGSVTFDDVNTACDFVKAVPKNSPGERSELDYFAMARDIWQFFVDRWTSEKMPPKQQKSIVQNDWGIYILKGFRNLIHSYPHSTDSEIETILGLTGIKEWLEYELILRLVLMARMQNIPFGKVEAGVLINSMGTERAEKVVDGVAFLMSKKK